MHICCCRCMATMMVHQTSINCAILSLCSVQMLMTARCRTSRQMDSWVGTRASLASQIPSTLLRPLPPHYPPRRSVPFLFFARTLGYGNEEQITAERRKHINNRNTWVGSCLALVTSPSRDHQGVPHIFHWRNIESKHDVRPKLIYWADLPNLTYITD